MHLNYNHLRYFWTIAHAGSLSAAAARLHVSQSALSSQVKKLEEQLGHNLFAREGRTLALTEAGRIALDYADTVFKTGDELLSTLQDRPVRGRRSLRVGAITTMSRNFQLWLLRSLVGRPDVHLSVHAGTLRELLAHLEAHTLDVVLANRPVPRDATTGWHSRRLREEPVSLVSRAEAGPETLRFPDDLADTPVVLPSPESDMRVAFDHVLARAGVRALIAAEVDDMAMLRLMARESSAPALVAPMVVRDELESGVLVERCRVPEITECFYAITRSRRFPNPLVEELIQGAESARQS